MPVNTPLIQAAACLALGLFAATAAAETVRGELTEDDAVSDVMNGYADTHTIDVEAGEVLVIDLASEAFDTYLVLTAPDGTIYQNDDNRDAEEYTRNSRLVVRAHEGGQWQITATGFSEDDTGPYTIEHSSIEVETFIETEGELDEEDGRSPKTGEYYEAHVFPVEAGQTLVVSMTSEDFDAYLTLYLPDGTMLYNDDAHGRDAQIVLTAAEAGNITVIATTSWRQDVGSYQLTVYRTAE